MKFEESELNDYPSSYYRQYAHYVDAGDLTDVPLFARIIAWAAEQRPKSILDIGCGVGYLISEIQKRTGAQVVGIDFSRSAIEEGKSRYPSLSLVRGNLLEPPLRPASFDWILAINVIEHLAEEEQLRLLEAAWKLLKKDGALVLSTPEPRSIYSKLVIHDRTHRKELPREAMLALVQRHFAIEEIVYTNSIGRFNRNVNSLLSFIFPADVVVLAINRVGTARDFLDEYLKVYPTAHALARACEAKALATMPPPQPILDIGCGDGSFMNVFMGGQSIRVGVDRSYVALRKARSCGVYDSLVVGDASDLPFKDGSFRSVVSNSAIEHMECVGDVLSESARVLQSGGRLVFTVPNPFTSEWWWDFRPWKKLKEAIWNHKELLGSASWNGELVKAGFAECAISEFANKDVITVLDRLFLPAALWFFIARLGVRLPAIGRYRFIRSLQMRLLQRVYWGSSKGEGGSYLIGGTRA